MFNETDKAAIKKGMRTLWLTWAALMGSLLIYLFVAHATGEEIKPYMGEDFPLELLRNILYGISIIELFLAHFLRKFIINSKNTGVSAELLKYNTQINQPPFVTKYTLAVMISLALAVSIAIYGLVLFLIGADYQTLYTFIVVSALAMFFYRPRRAQLEELAMADQPEMMI
ncbi:MAG TPA: hypothetical protein ENN23_08405 [Deltaproteobacteria bacterium]|nr:hypothetical protein [Deltaproteobacteria bacterium]